MAKITHGPVHLLDKKPREQRDLFPISQQVEKIVEVPIEVIKEVIIEKPVEIIKIIEVVKQVEVVKEAEPVIIEKIVEVIKEVEVPVIVREFEKVEIPVEVIVEKIVTVHNLEQVLEEKKKVEILNRKLKLHKIAIVSLIILTTVVAVIK